MQDFFEGFISSQMWGSQWLGGGGGVILFSHFMLFTFLEKNSGNTKKNCLRKTIISHLRFSLLEILKSAPSLTG